MRVTDSRRQTLTEAERERLDELLRARVVQASTQKPGGALEGRRPAVSGDDEDGPGARAGAKKE